MGAERGQNEAELARQIKVFRKQFRKDHGRDPSRRDMDRDEGIAAIYDAWLSIKSTQSASTSTLPTIASSSSRSTGSKRKMAPNAVISPSQREGSSLNGGKASFTVMAPPPTTPSKKKARTIDYPYVDNFKTPTKDRRQSSDNGSIHDSGRSIIDAPTTPKRDLDSPSINRKRQAFIKEGRTYESPSKLKALLSSFSSTQRTPSKGDKRDEEANLMDRLNAASATLPAYTPRTKARKRLRGEVVITPRKNGLHEAVVSSDHQQSSIGGQPVPKRRRGMGPSTLKDFGITVVAKPSNKSKDEKGHLWNEASRLPALGPKTDNDRMRGRDRIVGKDDSAAYDDESEVKGGDDDDDGDEDMLGPSPSVHRTIDRPISTFRPLFDVPPNGTLSEEEIEENDEDRDEDVDVSTALQRRNADDGVVHTSLQTASDVSDALQSTAATTEDDDQDLVVVPYQRYKSGDLRRPPRRSDDLLSDGEDDDMLFYNAFATSSQHREISPANGADSEGEEMSPVLDSLSLNSPQCTKAQHSIRRRAQKEVKRLLGADESLQIFDEWEEGGNEGGTAIMANAARPARKTNKVGPAIKQGKLRKGAKDMTSAVRDKPRAIEEAKAVVEKPRLILQNHRDQLGSDQDSDDAEDDDGDEWASEASSADYGLGDGYMSDNIDMM